MNSSEVTKNVPRVLRLFLLQFRYKFLFSLADFFGERIAADKSKLRLLPRALLLVLWFALLTTAVESTSNLRPKEPFRVLCRMIFQARLICFKEFWRFMHVG